jgi:DNA-binding protein H-NS
MRGGCFGLDSEGNLFLESGPDQPVGDTKMTTYQELVAQKAELDRQQAELEKQIADTLRAERQSVISQIKSLMSEHGISAADLASGKSGRQARSASTDSASPRKVAPKYRDPETGETWSGRGLKPKWLAAAIESGRTLEEFAV